MPRRIRPRFPWRQRSVEALVAHIRALEEREDYSAALAFLPPGDREGTVFISWFGAGYTAIGDDEEKRDDYTALLAKHALDEKWLSADATGPDGLRKVAAEAFEGRDDLASIFGDLARYQVDHGRFGEAFGFLKEIGEVHIEDDWATVEIGPGEFEFVRLEKAWYWQFVKLDRPSSVRRCSGQRPARTLSHIPAKRTPPIESVKVAPCVK